MFNRLLESNRKRQRRLGGAIASTLFHTLLIAVAVKATMARATPAPPKIDLIVPIYQPPRPQEPTTSPATPKPTSGSRTDTPLIPPPDVKPIGPIDLDVTGIPDPQPGDVTSHVFDRTPIILSGGDKLGPPNAGRPDEPFTWDVVDKPILAIPGTGNPRYPTTLQSAGLEGDVRAQFVVDTLGRVERGSIRVLDSTHALFAAAVRDALTRARFKPAEAGGHLVRQLAEQTFTFRITN